MITELAINSVDYTPIVSDKVSGSVLRDVSLGLNLKREVTIRHADYVDSKTKRPGRRSVARLDRYIEMTDGTIAPVSFMCIAMIPLDANVTSDIVEDTKRLSVNMHNGHEPGYTDIGTAVFVNAEQ